MGAEGERASVLDALQRLGLGVLWSVPGDHSGGMPAQAWEGQGPSTDPGAQELGGAPRRGGGTGKGEGRGGSRCPGSLSEWLSFRWGDPEQGTPRGERRGAVKVGVNSGQGPEATEKRDPSLHTPVSGSRPPAQLPHSPCVCPAQLRLPQPYALSVPHHTPAPPAPLSR